MMAARSIRARVTEAEGHDLLRLSPLDAANRSALVGRIRDVLGHARLRDGGVLVPGLSAPDLLTVPEDLELSWTESARQYAENRRTVLARHSAVREEVERIKSGGVEVARAQLEDLDDAHILDAHQIVDVAAMTVEGSPGLCVFDEQGAGKTVTVIFAHDLLVKRREVDLLLIVAPKSMVAEWPRDINRFKSDLYAVGILSGSRRAKREQLRRPFDVIVTNFETAASLEEELAALLRARDGRVMLVVDESFYVKNLHARRTQAIRRLREWCSRAYVLCGTPAPNRPEDVVQQLNVVDFGVTFGRVEIPDNRNDALPVVRSAMEQRGLFVRHLKRDVLPDLPGKTFDRVYIPMQPKQQQAYEGALRNLIVDLQATDDNAFHRELASFLARRMALLEICSHPGMINPGYDETPGKLVALDAIFSDLIDRRGEKVIVWSFFRYAIDRIVDRYARYGVVKYDGSVPDVADRREAVRRFQEDDDVRLFVGNPAAAGAGLTLHSARIAVYESLSNQAAHYLQSLDRIHRRGQTREVEYLVLLADGTIEADEYDRLLSKEASARDLLGDAPNEAITRESMLDSLQRSAAQFGHRR